MNRMLWAFLSYPLSLLVIFMLWLSPERHRESMDGLVFVFALYVIWIILALWFGSYYFKYLRLKNRRSFLWLMIVNTLSLVFMVVIMLVLGEDHIIDILPFVLVPSVSCFTGFSIAGLAYNACKNMDRTHGDMHNISEENA